MGIGPGHFQPRKLQCPHDCRWQTGHESSHGGLTPLPYKSLSDPSTSFLLSSLWRPHLCSFFSETRLLYTCLIVHKPSRTSPRNIGVVRYILLDWINTKPRLYQRWSRPSLNGIIMLVVTGDSVLVLEGKIVSLLNKRAIRLPLAEETLSGFYFRYFLIPKKGGGLYPILYLRGWLVISESSPFWCWNIQCCFGRYFQAIGLRQLTYRMGTSTFTYFIIFHQRRFLRFMYQGVTYEYLMIPFRLSLAPRVFTKCVECVDYVMRASGFSPI